MMSRSIDRIIPQHLSAADHISERNIMSLKDPVDKLPLAVRKNSRSHESEFLGKINVGDSTRRA